MMKKIGIILGLMLVAGCLGGYSPENRFYSLQMIGNNTDKILQTGNLSVGVKDVELPDYLDRPQIVITESSSPEVKLAEHDRWGNDLSAMMQRIVAADLSAYLPKAEVKAKTELSESFDYLLDIQIVRMDFVWNEKAVLEAWWYLTNNDGKIIKRQKFYEEESVDKDFASFVEAESKMLGNMSYNIAQALAKLKK